MPRLPPTGVCQANALLGLTLALLGRHLEAIRGGERAVALTPISRDALTGAFDQVDADPPGESQ